MPDATRCFAVVAGPARGSGARPAWTARCLFGCDQHRRLRPAFATRATAHTAANAARIGRGRRSGDRSEQLEVGGDVDRAGEAPGYRAEASVHAVHSLDVGASVRGDGEAVIDPDPLDHEDAVLGLDLACGLDLVALGIDVDVTRLQRAGKRAGQSPGGRSDDVVERRGVRRIPLRIDAVVLGHLRVDPERDRALLGGQVGEPLGAAQPLDPDLRDVADFSHALAIISQPVQIRGWVGAGRSSEAERGGRRPARPVPVLRKA